MEQNENRHFFHALEIKEEICSGCSHCISVCPTEAIRLKNGKALLVADHCIDCGECIRICPSEAITVNQDDFSEIFHFSYRIALIPSVFMGQFSEEIDRDTICSAIHTLGFTHIYEVENGVKILKDTLPKYQKEHSEIKPLISTFCPAIVRLVQVCYPSLVDHLVLQKPPPDIAAMVIQKELQLKNAKPEEIGIFYITPCPAKIVAIKDPVGESASLINGAINMDMLLNKIHSLINQKKVKKLQCTATTNALLPDEAGFALTGGEAHIATGRTLAIDGMQNAFDFLEKVENKEIGELDFLELRACDESCADGVLTARNKFLAVESLRKYASKNKKNGSSSPFFRDIKTQQEYLENNLSLNKLQPRSIIKLDDNFEKALQKREAINQIMEQLPQVNCSLCGAPACEALARDIAEGKSSIEHCIFIQKELEQNGKLSPKESAEKFKDIWGQKTEKNIES